MLQMNVGLNVLQPHRGSGTDNPQVTFVTETFSLCVLVSFYPENVRRPSFGHVTTFGHVTGEVYLASLSNCWFQHQNVDAVVDLQLSSARERARG